MVLKQILSALGGGLFKEVRELVDDVVTTKEEKETIKNALIVKELEFKQKQDELDLAYQKEISERHKNDMISDSWLSKNVRPLTLTVLVSVLVVMLLAKIVYNYEIDEALVDMFKYLSGIAFMFYFGSRGLEKILINRKT